MIIKNYLDFKNLILEDKNIEDDDPFASIEKDIKGNYNRIKNSLTKDGNLIEIRKYYFILDKKDNLAKRILVNKFEKGQITYTVINDSKNGKLDPNKTKTGENKPIVVNLRDIDIYKDLNKFIKVYPDFKEKSILLKQTQYIPKQTNDGGTDDDPNNSGGNQKINKKDQTNIKNDKPINNNDDAPIIDINSGKEIKKTGT